MRIFALILCIFIVQLAMILILEFRRPQRAVAWLCITFCCPPLGLLFYYALGREYRKSRLLGRRCVSLQREIRAHVAGKIHQVKEPADTGNQAFAGRPELLQLLSGLAESPLTQHNSCQVFPGTREAYEAMLEAMEQAQENIHMEFYIFREDGIGRRFQELMIRKARQGIRVRLLCDGLGSHKLGRRFVQELENGGVQVYFFLPPLTSLLDRRFNYRNHRKILVVDGRTGFTGGMNIGDDYLGKNPKMGFWRDTHLRMEGDAVYQLQYVFLRDWRLASGDIMSHPRFFPRHSCTGREAVQIVSGGPDGSIDAIQELFFASICAAKQRIWITSPYFIPDPAILRALKNAVLSGVEVRMIIPAKPDNRVVYYATLSYLEDLQEAGVKFYRYTRGFMHAKVMIVDHLLALVGSANLDMRSFYSNFELTAVLLGPERIAALAEDFSRDLEHSEYIDPQRFQKRPENVKRLESLCKLLSPLL